MDDRRVALLVAGAALIVIGIVTSTFPRGALLGLLSLTAGIIIAVPASVQLVGAALKRPPRDAAASARAQKDALRERSVPGVSFWRWSSDTGWGTTPWGVAARVVALALVTVLIAFLSDSAEADLPLWPGVLLRTAVILGFVLLITVPAWIIERVTKPLYILPRGVDLGMFLPAAAISALSAVALTAGIARGWILAAAALQLVGGVVAGALLARADRSTP